VSSVFQKQPTGFLRLENPLFAFDAEGILNSAMARDHFDELGRTVRVELVRHEDPARRGIGVDGSVDVRNEVDLGPSGSNRSTLHLAASPACRAAVAAADRSRTG